MDVSSSSSHSHRSTSISIDSISQTSSSVSSSSSYQSASTAPTIIRQTPHTTTSSKKFSVTNLTRDVNAKTAELKNENKQIMPRKINQTKLGILAIASIVALIAAGTLAMVGVAFLMSGVGTAAGLGLLGAAAIVGGFGALGLYYTHTRGSKINQIDANKQAIKQMQEIATPTESGKANPLAQFVHELRLELKLTHFDIPTLIHKYPEIATLYKLRDLALNETANSPIDSRQPGFKDHSARLNYARAQLMFYNKLLQRSNNLVFAYDQKIARLKNSPNAIKRYNEEIGKELEKVKIYKKLRTQVIKELDNFDDLSFQARSQRRGIKALGRQLFSSIDGSPENKKA